MDVLLKQTEWLVLYQFRRFERGDHGVPQSRLDPLDIGKKTGLASSTVKRHLSSLQGYKLVRRDGPLYVKTSKGDDYIAQFVK